MATKPKTDLVRWEDELAKEADIASGMEQGGNSTWFSIRGGILSLNDMQLPDNQIAAIVLDSMIENVYYDKDFDPDVVSPPKCFALGRNEATLAPHENVVEAGQQENDTCAGCPQNEWGSGRGKGKACANRRRLSLLAAGDINGKNFEIYDDDHFATAPIALLKLPVTSVKPYGGYVNQIANVMRRPLFGVFSLIRVVPDPKTMFKVLGTYIDKVPDRLLPIITQRRRETQHQLEQPYTYDEEEPAPPPPPPARGKVGAARAKAKY